MSEEQWEDPLGVFRSFVENGLMDHDITSGEDGQELSDEEVLEQLNKDIDAHAGKPLELSDLFDIFEHTTKIGPPIDMLVASFDPVLIKEEEHMLLADLSVGLVHISSLGSRKHTSVAELETIFSITRAIFMLGFMVAVSHCEDLSKEDET